MHLVYLLPALESDDWFRRFVPRHRAAEAGAGLRQLLVTLL
jgi:hypothetical protein